MPLWNIQQLVIARVADRASYLAARRFAFTVSAILTAAMGLIALPGIDDVVFGVLLGLEGEVKRLAIEGYRLLFIASFFMGWRSFYHGALIGKSHTAPIRSAAIARLLVLLPTLGGLLLYGQLNGLMIAIWSMLASTGGGSCLFGLARAATALVSTSAMEQPTARAHIVRRDTPPLYIPPAAT